MSHVCNIAWACSCTERGGIWSLTTCCDYSLLLLDVLGRIDVCKTLPFARSVDALTNYP